MDEKLGERLIAFRNRKGLSQDELSMKLGVSRQSISNWENGSSQPSIDFIKKLAEIYEVSVDDLLNTDKNIEDCYSKGTTFEYKDKKDKGKSHIHISKKGIFIDDGDGEESLKFEFGEDKDTLKETIENEIIDSDIVDAEKNKRKKALYKSIQGLINIIFILSAMIAYCILGFLLPNNEGWSKWWIILIFSFVPGELYRTFANKNPYDFPITFLAIGTYCLIGEFFNIWHPTWILMLTIPVYYILVSSIKSIIKNAKRAKGIK